MDKDNAQANQSLKNIKEVFTAFFEANVVQILDKFLSEGDFNWSIKEKTERIYEEKGQAIVEEVNSTRDVILSAILWDEVKDADEPFILEIKEKAQNENVNPQDLFTAKTTVNKTEFDFLKDREAFKAENAKFLEEIDYVINFFYVTQAVPTFIYSLTGDVNKLFIYRTISVPDPTEFLKKFLSGEQERGLGQSWSRSASKAQSYEGSAKDIQIRLHGYVPLECIDILMTIVKNISGYRSEAEFFLKKDEDIAVYKLEVFTFDMSKHKAYDLPEAVIHRS